MKFYALITLVFSFNVFSHTANDGDLRELGYWQNQNGIIRLWSYANQK